MSLVSEYITPREANEIIQSCSKPRDRLILRVMWETGGRLGEVLSLIPDYVDPVNNCIYLPNLKQHKDKIPLKRIYLFPESMLCSDLTQWTSDNSIDRHSWMFPGKSRTGQVSNQYVWYLLSSVSRSTDRWKRKEGISTRLGIRKVKTEQLKPAWPHLFRHGAAMNIYHRTGRLDVTQKQLGHSSIQTTESYASLSDEDRKTIIQGKSNVSDNR